MQPKICSFSETDKTILAGNLAVGREICLALTGKQQGQPDATMLDKAFQAWVVQPETARVSHKDLANGLGSLFGEIIKKDFGFVWQMITDQYGPEPALIDENTGSVVFPVNAVWKRIEPEIDSKAFFKAMYDSIAGHLNRIKTGEGGR
jgi:hypothetical protein